jgi:quercetin dioxygenase-like cupin family protein
MPDTTITKVDSGHSPEGKQGQKYLASGKTISMRLWDEGPISNKESSTREYETVGYVMEGSATLTLEGQKVELKAGDSWVVPKGANHTYEIKEHFKAIEATSPPAEAHGRD